uniref:Protein kinase domain-containing protein n=3 Tax=Brassica TaxID=3705 RepID=A0A0D3C1L9_BRAOL
MNAYTVSPYAVPLPLPLPLPDGDSRNRNAANGKGSEEANRDPDRFVPDRTTSGPPLTSVNGVARDSRNGALAVLLSQKVLAVLLLVHSEFFFLICSENGALCAMKEVELFPDDPKSAECIKQLNQEIKLLTNLQHPNIRVYDRFFIYLEYVHPGSINKYIQDHCGGTMTESVVRNFTRHILSGLAYLHSKKTVHRDIKGANLLVDTSGVVKLADFGMAKHLTRQRADLSLKGSPYWMAPELMQAVMQRDSNPYLAFVVDT